MKKLKLSVLEVYNLRQELNGSMVKTETANVPIAPGLITFFKDLRLKFWLEKLNEVLEKETVRFEKIKEAHFKEVFGEAPKDEDLQEFRTDKDGNKTPNTKVVEFQKTINDLSLEEVEIECYPFNDEHLNGVKTTYHFIPKPEEKNQVLVTREDTTGTYENLEFVPSIFLRKIVEPAL